MTIRPFRPSDADAPGGHANLIRNARRWIAAGYTTADLCLMLEAGDVLRGGVIYSATMDPEETTLLDLSLSDDAFHLGADFLRETLARLPGERVGYHLYNDSPQYESYLQCLMDAGFLVEQEKLSFRYTAPTPPPEPEGLTFRPLTQTGEGAFLRAFADVTDGTLDRADLASISRLGREGAAAAYFDSLKEIDFQPDLWTLAFAGDTPVGLVIPQYFGEGVGAINYIGVYPALRGRGYVDALLQQGTRLLYAGGITQVIADIDTRNFPMQAALLRTGYVFKQDMVALARPL